MEVERIEAAIADLINARDADCLLEYPQRETIVLAIQALREKMKREQETDGWISVADRMPERDDLVIAYTDRKHIIKAYYRKGRCWVSGGFVVIPEITHWRPWPDPPKEAHP